MAIGLWTPSVKAVVALLALAGALSVGAASVVSRTAAAAPEAAPVLPWSITPLARRRDAALRSMSLLYDVSWSQWLQAGTIQVAFAPRQDGAAEVLRARAKARSSGPARVVWPYKSSLRAEISGKTLLPSYFEHVQTERGETTRYEATYRDGRMSVASLLKPRDGQHSEHETRAYDIEQIRGILSALLYLQQTELRAGNEIALLVQPLDRLYLVSFRVAGTEQRKVLERTWKTTRLEVGIRKVTDDLKLAAYTKMRRATLWLSDDADQVPVEIQADLLIGFVSVRLVTVQQ